MIRADKTDPEMLALMQESGCQGVCVGIESANQAVLQNVGKGETIGKIREGIQRIHAAGLSITGMFMIGNPGDTLQTIRESIEFAKKEPIDTVRFYLAIPYPRTRLWEFVESHGRFINRDYTNYHDYSHIPIFETDDFTYDERIMAYREACEVMFPDGFPEKLNYNRDDELTVEHISDSGQRIKPRFAPQ